MAKAEERVRVEVVYALPGRQRRVEVSLPLGATVAQALRRSGLLEAFPEIDAARNPVGIFGRPCTLERVLRAGDRVEIYRPLQVDPKQARRQAAQRGGSGSSRGGC